jgi:gamma-glutamyltranspeptidase/glutathione hydrolase
MYVGKDGQALPMRDPKGQLFGWRASGVPGSVAGFALALKNYGSGNLTWAELIEPSRKLAAEGHVITSHSADLIARQAKILGQSAETKRIYLNGGTLYKAGEGFRQPELAATLERLQKQGPSDFYEGETAHRIAAAMQAHQGTITLDDLKGYRAVEREPLRGKYRGYDVVTVPPPSSGGIAILQILTMLEPFDVGAMGPESAAKYHLFIEVMRRAYRDRAEYLGDPDFVNVPVAGLLDPAYVAGLMKNFDPRHATSSATLQPGKPAGWEAIAALKPPAVVQKESHETTQFTVVDAQGNAVSNTYTLNAGFGSGVTIPGTGLLMNDEMGDFAAVPGTPNLFGLVQGEADAIAPGKRPLSSMSPTFVFKDGKLYFATGSPGGGTIINTVIEIITNVIDHHMSLPAAVAQRRFNHQWKPEDTSFEKGLDPQTAAALQAMGHKLTLHDNFEGVLQGDGESIMIDPATGHRLGAADPRKPDARAVGN